MLRYLGIHLDGGCIPAAFRCAKCARLDHELADVRSSETHENVVGSTASDLVPSAPAYALVRGEARTKFVERIVVSSRIQIELARA